MTYYGKNYHTQSCNVGTYKIVQCQLVTFLNKLFCQQKVKEPNVKNCKKGRLYFNFNVTLRTSKINYLSGTQSMFLEIDKTKC